MDTKTKGLRLTRGDGFQSMKCRAECCVTDLDNPVLMIRMNPAVVKMFYSLTGANIKSIH